MILQSQRIGIAAVVALGFALSPALGQHDRGGHGMGGQKPNEGHSMSMERPACPVSGEPVNLAVSLATDDGPVFFCCNHCVSKYKANSAKYAGGVLAQRNVLADRPRVQVTCPVSGDPVDSKAFTDYGEQRVLFCCKGCISKFESDPGKYKSALANSYTYETKCPVMGEDISPKAFTTLAGGHKVYFCCPRCENDLLAKPAEYLPKLKAQGYDFTLEEMIHAKGATQKGDGHDSHDHRGDDDDH